MAPKFCNIYITNIPNISLGDIGELRSLARCDFSVAILSKILFSVVIYVD